MAKSASLVTHSSTFSPTYSSRNDLDRRAAPKCSWPSMVTLIAIYNNNNNKNFKFRFLEVQKITVLATWFNNVIRMTFSALSYHPQLPYKLLILISTHNTRSSFRSENTSEGIWSIIFHPRFLEGRKETKHSVSLFFGFVVTYRERDLFIDLLACVQKTLFF